MQQSEVKVTQLDLANRIVCIVLCAAAAGQTDRQDRTGDPNPIP